MLILEVLGKISVGLCLFRFGSLIAINPNNEGTSKLKIEKSAELCDLYSRFTDSVLRLGYVNKESLGLAFDIKEQAFRHFKKLYKKYIKNWFKTVHEGYLIDSIQLYPENGTGLGVGEKRNSACVKHSKCIDMLLPKKHVIKEELSKFSQL